MRMSHGETVLRPSRRRGPGARMRIAAGAAKARGADARARHLGAVE